MIIGEILTELYNIRPPSLEARLWKADKIKKSLEDWFKQTSSIEPSIIDYSLKHHGMALNMVYTHALILLNRRFLLDNVRTPGNGNENQQIADERANEKAKECLSSAMTMTNLVSTMSKKNLFFSSSWVLFTTPSTRLL